MVAPKRYYFIDPVSGLILSPPAILVVIAKANLSGMNIMAFLRVGLSLRNSVILSLAIKIAVNMSPVS